MDIWLAVGKVGKLACEFLTYFAVITGNSNIPESYVRIVMGQEPQFIRICESFCGCLCKQHLQRLLWKIRLKCHAASDINLKPTIQDFAASSLPEPLIWIRELRE